MIKQLLKSRFLDENDVNDVMVLRKLFYEILIMFIAAISYWISVAEEKYENELI